MPRLIMKLAVPVSPYPTFPRKREKGQTNRYASFTLKAAFYAKRCNMNIDLDQIALPIWLA